MQQKASTTIRPAGGSNFAENPELSVPEARILWHSDLDPTTLPVKVEAASARKLDSVDLSELEPWLTIVTNFAGRERCVFSDGFHRIRLDIEGGRLLGKEAVRFEYRLSGIASAEPKILSLRRLVHLCRHRSFSRTLFPFDPAIPRLVAALRVHDAVTSGASQREIAEELFPNLSASAGWRCDGEFLRSRVRRLVREARHFAGGGYRLLLRAKR